MRKTGRLYYIDSIKGLFALCIASFHLFNSIGYNEYEWLRPFYLYGNMLTSFFFFSSGYFLEKTRIRICFVEFMKKRLIKIYKMYIPIIIGTIVVKIIFKELIRPINILFSFLMLQGGYINDDVGYFMNSGILGIDWFLGPLFFCYFLYWIINDGTRRTEYKYIIEILIVIYGIIIMESNISLPMINSIMSQGLVGFYCGVLYENYENYYSQRINKGSVLLVAMTAMVLIPLILKYTYRTMEDCLIMLCIVTYPILFMSCFKLDILKKFLENNILRFVGNVSSEIYFSHVLILNICSKIKFFQYLNFGYKCLLFYFCVLSASYGLKFLSKSEMKFLIDIY